MQSFAAKRNSLQFSIDESCNIGAKVIANMTKVTYTISQQMSKLSSVAQQLL